MARPKNVPFRAVFRLDSFGWTHLRDKGYGAGHVGAIHKREMDGRPYRFANELICGRLAQFLLLPCPPFGFTHFTNQEGVDLPRARLFSSLDFDYERDTPPLPDFDACVRCLPELCAGILAFDILIANPDRSPREHIWCDDSQKPTRLLLLDHDYALLGDADDGPLRIDRVIDELGLNLTAGSANHHPFLRRIPSARLFDEWFRRIFTLSTAQWFLKEVCKEAEGYGIGRRESKAVRSFLEYRSRNLETIITNNKREFRGIVNWSEGLFQ